MSEHTTTTTELASQYIAQVANDLERNTKEQEHISAEITALQEQLVGLQHDRSVLENMQKALGDAVTATTPAADDTATPAVPRQKAATEPSTGKRTQTTRTKKSNKSSKSSTASGGKTAKKTAAEKPAPKASAAKTEAQPTLVELIRRHLTKQSEPRSAAEISTALSQAHPDRRVQTNVVRTTLEGLVAKSHAHRTKQGSSVFYSAEPAQQTGPAAAEPESEKAAVSG